VAQKRGQLLKQPCEKCGEADSQKHHEDYSKPLEVRWLCARCHRVEHETDMTKPRKLTEAQEDDILRKVNLRKTLGSKALCAEYAIGRSTLLDIIRRAKARQERICAKVAITSNIHGG